MFSSPFPPLLRFDVKYMLLIADVFGRADLPRFRLHRAPAAHGQGGAAD